MRVFNLGIGGDTIRDINARMGEALARDPDMMIIGCCANDIFKYNEADGQHTKLSLHHRQKLWPLVLAKAKSMCDKVLVTNGVVLVEDYVGQDGNGIKLVDYRNHLNFIEECSRKAQVEVCMIPETLVSSENFSHNIHWNAKGYDRLTEVFFSKLQQLGWV